MGINKSINRKLLRELISKYKCHSCKEIAVWDYMPSGVDLYYCDDCVPRGCSCQTDDDGNDLKDDLGRLLPCCEYDYNIDGWEKQN